MKKAFFCIMALAMASAAAIAAITADSTFKTVYAGGTISQGAAVTNTVDTAGAVGVAAFVVPYSLAGGGRLDIEFAGAVTNGAPFVSCPTNNARLLGSYTVTNGTLLKVSYPAANVPGRFLRVVIKSVSGTNSVAAVFAAETGE